MDRFVDSQDLEMVRLINMELGIDLQSDTRETNTQELNEITAADASPIRHSHPQTNAEVVSRENRHPTQLLSDKTQLQQFPHLPRGKKLSKTTKKSPASPQKSATLISMSENASSASRIRLRTLAPANQQAAQICHQTSVPKNAYRPYTEEDFAGIRRGGRLMDDKKTWDVLTEINHHPAFNRVYNLPPLPPNPHPRKKNSTGISNFKWYGDLVKALDTTDRRLLQEFIVVSKHYASTGQLPSQPSTSQATANTESDGEEHNGEDSFTHPRHSQESESNKRNREQEQGNENPPGHQQKRLRTNESLQGSRIEWKFTSVEEADAYLTRHGHSTILEIANKYLLSQGHPVICIEKTEGASLPENCSRSTCNANLTGFQHHEQNPSKFSMPSPKAHGTHRSQKLSSPANFVFNRAPASIWGIPGPELSESVEVQPDHPTHRGERKAAVDGADRGAPLTKKRLAGGVMTKMKANRKASALPKRSTQKKAQRQLHNKPAVFGTHSDGPLEISMAEEPDVDGQRFSQLDSGYQSPNTGSRGTFHERLDAPGNSGNTDQAHSATTRENPNFSKILPHQAKTFGQTQVQESTYHFSEEGHVYNNLKNLDFGVTNFEFNSQPNGYSGYSEFDLESSDLILPGQEQAHDSNIGSKDFESTLRNDRKARDIDFDFESLDQFLLNQENGEFFGHDSQNANLHSQVLQDARGFNPFL